jgi:amino acid permease
VHISLCNVPSFIVSLIGVTFVKELTLDAVSSPLFIVFTVIGGFIFVLMSALEEQTKQERAQRISNSIK